MDYMCVRVLTFGTKINECERGLTLLRKSPSSMKRKVSIGNFQEQGCILNVDESSINRGVQTSYGRVLQDCSSTWMIGFAIILEVGL